MASSPASTARKTQDLPLLDEVNELIEKERILLSLKLLEQKQESEEWKLKYESLITKVSDNVEENADFETLAMAVDVAAELPKAAQQDVTQRLRSQKYSWVLDLSYLNVDLNSFTGVCKSTFGSKDVGHGFRIVNFSHCDLTDQYTTPLLSVLRNIHVDALDLSHNELSEVALLQMLSILKVRRPSLPFATFSCCAHRIAAIRPSTCCWMETSLSLRLCSTSRPFWTRSHSTCGA